MYQCEFLHFFSFKFPDQMIYFKWLFKGGCDEIEKLVDKVIEENLDTVKSFKNPRRREFAHYFLGGMLYK